MHLQAIRWLVSGFTLLALFGSPTVSALERRGTGFFVSENGHILTAYHVVQDSAQIQVRRVDRAGVRWAKIIGFDRDLDLAVLTIDEPSAPLKVSTYAHLAEGAPVNAYGFALSGNRSRALVKVAGSVVGVAGLGVSQAHIRFTGALLPGQSGGPLLDEAGFVVGMVKGRFTANPQEDASQPHSAGLNLAVSAPLLVQATQSLLQMQYSAVTALSVNGSRSSIPSSIDISVVQILAKSSTAPSLDLEPSLDVKATEQSTHHPVEVKGLVRALLLRGFKDPARTSVGYLLIRPSSMPIKGPDQQTAIEAELVISLDAAKQDVQGRPYFSSLSRIGFDCKSKLILVAVRETFSGAFLTDDLTSRLTQKNSRWVETPSAALKNYLTESLCK